MRITPNSVRQISETMFGKADATCTCTIAKDGSGCNCGCTIVRITEVASALGVRNRAGRVVKPLAYFPDHVACGKWFRQVLPDLSVRASEELAGEIYTLNDQDEIDAAWARAEYLIEAIFAKCRGEVTELSMPRPLDPLEQVRGFLKQVTASAPGGITEYGPRELVPA